MTKPQKNNSDISSPRVVIRPYIPWSLRLLAIFIIVSLLLALSWGMYHFGSKSSNTSTDIIGNNNMLIDDELTALYDANTCLHNHTQERCAILSKFARRLQMNNTVHDDLTKQIRLLGEENDRLKEELVYFQHLMDNNGGTNSGLSIERFNLTQGQSARQYRYTLLLTQGGQRPKDFEGNLKFLITLRQNSERKVIALASNGSSKLFPVNFKHYKRVDKSFQVPENTVVENIQVQVFEKNKSEAKLTQTAKLSS
ncbi:MAG: hypothetical protein OEX82_05245 [Nitrosomonas sp.]|nr:hypothetical protein [Nitrosomonas sp.]